MKKKVSVYTKLNNIMTTILIPVFNDWKSLNKLLTELNNTLKKNSKVKILVIDDNSTIKSNFKIKNLKKIKQIKILKLNKNVGSQKAIALGLDYIRNTDFKDFIIIMDGDGEDNPQEINKMLSLANKDKNYVIVSCRTGRHDSVLMKLFYKLHLFLCFLFTGKWISFGNFSCLHSNILKELFKDNSVWYAYSSGVIRNTKIRRTFAIRQKRYYGPSKMNLYGLIDHSLRVISVSYERVVFFSALYTFLIFIYSLNIGILFCFSVVIFNILIIAIKKKHFINKIDHRKFTKSIFKV